MRRSRLTLSGLQKEVEQLRSSSASLLPTAARTDEEWYAEFRRWGEAGHFKGEPDFPVAMAAYRQAIDNEALNPSTALHFNGVKEFLWVCEMARRVTRGQPAVTEADFREMADWFARVETQLPLVLFEPVDNPFGKWTVYRNRLRSDVNRGARCGTGGETVHMLRAVRKRYGIL